MVSIWFVGLAACGSATDGDTGEEPDTVAVEVPRASCEEPLGGVDWGSAPPYESDTGIAAEIAAYDLTSLDQSIDISSLLALYRGHLAYALEIPPDELGDTLDRDAALAKGPMGEVALASLLAEGGDGSSMDFILYRQGLHRYGTCSRAPPLTLEDFKLAVSDFTVLPHQDVDSAAKCDTRRLYMDTENGVYVAESIVGDRVRETEIVMDSSRSDGQLDFIVYDEDGNLSNRTEFPTLANGPHVVVSAPYACMTCHFETEASETAWTFSVLYPDGTGPCAITGI